VVFYNTVSGDYVKATSISTAGVVLPANGGTGVANGTNNTITFTGNYTLGLTLTGNTSVTFPTSGTLLTTTGSGSSLTFGTGTLSLAGNVTHSGSFTQTFTATGNTSLTLPTSGYLISSVTNMAANPVTGTPSSSTYLRGDGTWATVAAQVYPGAGIAVSTGSAWTTSLTAPSGTIVGTTDSQTLTNKTLTGYTETVYALATSGSIALNPANGTIQTCALAGNPTFTDSLSSGQSLILMLTNGASYTVTYPTITWVSSTGNVAPTLTAASTLVFWKVSTTLYGAYIGSYV
jgi:hypothetical protein